MTKQQVKQFMVVLKAWSYSQAMAVISSFRPTVAALVFFVLFGFSQNCFTAYQRDDKCTVVYSVTALTFAKQLPGRVLDIGTRSIQITQHAAQRMQERGVSEQEVISAIKTGQLFAYLDDPKVKIGYYNPGNGLFLAVDQRHKRLITVIKFTDKGYPERVMSRQKDNQAKENIIGHI